MRFFFHATHLQYTLLDVKVIQRAAVALANQVSELVNTIVDLIATEEETYVSKDTVYKEDHCVIVSSNLM